jgi:hypothetical protein
MSQSQLYEEFDKGYEQDYGELAALGIARNRREAAMVGQLPLDDNISEDMEGVAAKTRLDKTMSDIQFAKQQMSQLRG